LIRKRHFILPILFVLILIIYIYLSRDWYGKAYQRELIIFTGIIFLVGLIACIISVVVIRKRKDGV